MKVLDKKLPFFGAIGNTLARIVEKDDSDSMYYSDANISLLKNSNFGVVFSDSDDYPGYSELALMHEGVEPNDLPMVEKRNALMNLLNYNK